MVYIPVHIHTVWSLLDSTVALEALAEKAKEYGMPAVCMTDHGNIKALVGFHKAMTKRGIRPIIGCELNIRYVKAIYRLTVLAKNKAGYHNLIKLISFSNEVSNLVEGEPTVGLDQIVQYSSGMIGLIGDLNSELAHCYFESWEDAYRAATDESCEKLLSDGWLSRAKKIIEKHRKIFEHLFIFADQSTLPVLRCVKNCSRLLSTKVGIPFLSSNNVHYLNPEDRPIHDLILRSAVEGIRKPTENVYDFRDYRIFAEPGDHCCLLPTLAGGEATLTLLDFTEEYSIRENPILPVFKGRDGSEPDPDKLIYALCRQGFVDRGLIEDLRDNFELKKIYGDRVKEELRIFSEIGLSSYFLIVKDIIDYCREQGMPADVRGSSTGCLINYLLGISSVDPMCPDPTMDYMKERELPLSRFYNEGRNTKDHISLPDLDVDCPPHFRQNIINYIYDRYGSNCVAHIITHSRFKGRGAIKEVFRLSNVPNYYEISDDINKQMVDEAKISDELAEIQQDNPEYGIIQWNIDNVESVANAYEEYKEIFDIAIMLEQIPKHASVHPAGLIIADRPLSTILPMVHSEKLGGVVVGIEGAEVEELGGFKLDLLGVSMLEKLFLIQHVVNNKLTETPDINTIANVEM